MTFRPWGRNMFDNSHVLSRSSKTALFVRGKYDGEAVEGVVDLD